MKFSMIYSLSSLKYLLDSSRRTSQKGVKRLLISPQYIEHKISTFNEIFNRMKERKNLSYSLRKVAHPFKSSLNSMFLPILSLPEAFTALTNVNYVKNAIFENYFEQFSHFSTV